MRVLVTLMALLSGQVAALTPVHRVSFYTAEHARSACGKTMRGAGWVQVAVSRDLMRRLGCHARVRVTLHTPKGGVRSFAATVNDLTARRFRTTVDVLILSRRDALDWGVTSGSLRLLQSQH